ncbi:hypothetical protein [Streptomyces sioyaensis]|uniref:hypothetical protein n=1 Tax=Streptomyces sioyaensis TaxID=67364 RepID=UPI003797D763
MTGRDGVLRRILPSPSPAARPGASPQWPAGTVGAINHCEGQCAVAVTHRTAPRTPGCWRSLDFPTRYSAGHQTCSP